VWKVALVAILLALGVGGLLVGMSSCTRSFELLERRLSLESLPAAEDARPGDACYAEGTLARSVAALSGEPVAYRISEYRSKGWAQIEAHAPPFVIDTRDGTRVAVDGGYAFAVDLREWAHETSEMPPSGFATGAVRTETLVVGRPVLVVGRRVDEVAGAVRMTADSVAGMDRAAALEGFERGAATNRSVSRLTFVGGLVGFAAAAAVWRWLPSTRRPRKSRDADPQAWW
jgi:hypothetical protein